MARLRKAKLAAAVYVALEIYKGRKVVNFTFRLLYCCKELRYSLNMRLGKHQSRSGRFGEAITLLHLSELETRTVRSVQSNYTD